MDQKWIQILVILVFYQKMTLGAVEIKEGENVEISCTLTERSTMVIWFRVLDKSGLEFIASYNNNGQLKSKSPLHQSFSDKKILENKLILKSFNKDSDSGVYSCAIIQHNGLKFGEVTRLVGVPVPTPKATTAKPPGMLTTPTACNSPSSSTDIGKTEISPAFSCPLILLGPLAGACGLLLLLLIITILYCNKMRTRRCPHHHRRKPRTTAPEKQMMVNRHV